MVNTILVLALAAAVAAALVFAAKWQEAKQASRDEQSVWLTEIKKVEHDKEILLEGGKKDVETIQWYANKLAAVKEEMKRCRAGNHALQDKLSAILCPRNDHVWRDGVCVKCGRVQDD